MDLCEDVAGGDLISALHPADDADCVVDLVVFRLAAGAEVHCSYTDCDRAKARHDAVRRREDRPDDRSCGKRLLVRVASLRGDPAFPDLRGGTVRDGSLRPPPALRLVHAEVGERKQVRTGREHELGEVGRPVAAHGRERLADLESVPDRLPERLIHVRQQADRLPARLLPEREHRLRELARVVQCLHERAVPHLHIEDDRVGAARDLLRHDARRDQRDLVDGRRHVAKGVEHLVRRHEVGGLPDDRDTDILDLCDQLGDGELDAEAGNRLELVERASGVAEATAGHLPERDAARRDDRADRERRLVPNAPRRVLVDDLAAERAVQVDRLAAPDHRVRQRERLRRGQAAEADGHQERRHLVVRYLPMRVAEDELAQLVSAELLARAASVRSARPAGSRRADEDDDVAGADDRLVEARQTRGELGSSRRRRDEVARGLVVGERDRAMDVTPFHGAEVAPQGGFPVLGAKVARLRADLADELPELGEAPFAARPRDEPAVRAKHASDLADREIDIGRVVEHPGRDDTVEAAVGEGQILDVAGTRVHASRTRELDHPLRLVDRDHLAAELVRHPLCELATTAADLEHLRRSALGDGGERNVVRIGPSGGGLDDHSRGKPALVFVLL